MILQFPLIPKRTSEIKTEERKGIVLEFPTPITLRVRQSDNLPRQLIRKI